MSSATIRGAVALLLLVSGARALAFPANDTAKPKPAPRPAKTSPSTKSTTAAAKSGATKAAASRTATAAKSATTAKKRTAATKSVARRRRKPVQMAPTRDRIAEIQAALTNAGSYKGEPTGKWDAATIRAMTDFQASQGLSPTGKVSALTLQKLRLGSEVAGRAAPIAPLPDTAAGINSGSLSP